MEAGCSRQTIINLETWRTQPYASTLSSIRQALEKAGVEFGSDPDAEVRLRAAKGRDRPG